MGILAFIAIFIFTYFAYKTARDNGRNPFVWAAVTFATGFGLQIIVPLLIGLVLAIVWIAMGSSSPETIQEDVGGIATIIGIISLVLSFVGMFLILRYVAQLPEEAEPVTGNGPPPPPIFGQDR